MSSSPAFPIMPAFFACVIVPTAFDPALAITTSPTFRSSANTGLTGISG
jgi:hypothetical protein